MVVVVVTTVAMEVETETEEGMVVEVTEAGMVEVTEETKAAEEVANFFVFWQILLFFLEHVHYHYGTFIKSPCVVTLMINCWPSKTVETMPLVISAK